MRRAWPSRKTVTGAKELRIMRTVSARGFVVLAAASIAMLCAAPATAQTFTSYELQVTGPVGNNSITTPFPIAASAVLCNLTPLPAPGSKVTNPTIFQINDPDHAGKACTFTVAAIGVGGQSYANLLPGDYTATITGTTAAGLRSVPSLPVPAWTIAPVAPPPPPPPPQITGLLAIRQE
jgi:hypothetical protein